MKLWGDFTAVSGIPFFIGPFRTYIQKIHRVEAQSQLTWTDTLHTSTISIIKNILK